MTRAIRDILYNEKKLNDVTRIAFDAVDSDKSGHIDTKELADIMDRIAIEMGTDRPTPQDVQDVINHLDTDKTGTIEFEEFKMLIKDILESMLEFEE
jgi:Ca2+-binding EF-hand superfamily protein